MERQELPEGWVVAPLGELATFEMGQAPPGSASNFSGIGSIFVKAGEFGDRHPVVREWTTQPLKFATKGDVLICVVGATAGKLNLGIDCAIGRSVAAIRPSAALYQLALYFQLLISVLSLRASSTGSAQGVISKKILAAIPVALPPLNEQRRIAAKLDTTLAAVEACRQRLDGVAAILKRFRQAVLAAATSGELTREWREETGTENDDQLAAGSYLDPATLPENYQRLRKKALVDSIPMWPDLYLPSRWTIQTIGSLYKANYIIDFADGNHGSLYPRESDFGDEGVKFLTASQVSDDGSIAFEDCPILGFQKARQLVKGWSKNGDVILTHNATVGRCALIDEEVEPFLLGTSATFYRFNSDFIKPGYAWLLFSSPFFQDQLRACMEQTTRNQVPITKQTSLGFILPPILEQVEIWRRCKELFALAGCLEARLIAARKTVDRLTPALLAKAFRGELVPQDPSEEPASVLLERIRAARQEEAAAGKPLRRGRRKSAAHSEQTPLPAAPAPPDLLAQLLQECGALSERALLAASELEPGRFRRQLALEVEAGNIREELEGGQQVLMVAGEE
jgi:type I restriction enzyme S subunit